MMVGRGRSVKKQIFAINSLRDVPERTFLHLDDVTSALRKLT